MLTGIVTPATIASASTSVTFLNPLGYIEPAFNHGLAERPTTPIANLDIGLLFYQNAANRESVVALGGLLNARSITQVDVGTPIGPKTVAQYDAWAAAYDAIVLGVADEAVSAWWSLYHVRQLETRGTPVVLLTTEAFVDTVRVAAEDHGITSVRTAVMSRSAYSRAFTRLGDFNSAVLHMQNNVVGGTVLTQAIAALTAPLTSAEANPAPITQAQLGVPAWTTQTASNLRAFNDMAMELGFGDGLPLRPPTAFLVNEMLEATTRQRDEIIGKAMPRGGLITVEKVAINSVMAGLEPKAFPFVLAAMEAYANAWETDKMFYHALTTGAGPFSLMLIMSGPLAAEIGVHGGRGFGGSEFPLNNTIGRAFRLSVSNIGHSSTIDESNRIGREQDHTLLAFRETCELLPPGWESHSELMGFPAGSNSITLHSVMVNRVRFNSAFAYHPLGLLGHLRNGMALMGDCNSLTFFNLAPGFVWDIHRDWDINNKEDVRDYMMTVGISASHEGWGAQYLQAGAGAANWLSGYIANRFGPGATGTAAAAAARIQDRHLIMPIVVGGGGLSHFHLYPAAGYGARGFQTQMVTGATGAFTNDALSQGPTAPGAPQNLTVTVTDAAQGNVTLSWGTPLRNGGSAVTGYQISIHGGFYAGRHGGMLGLNEIWIDIPADTTSHTLTGLTVGATYNFVVRAVNGVVNAAEIVSVGDTDVMEVSHRASGNGAWARATAIIRPPSVNWGGGGGGNGQGQAQQLPPAQVPLGAYDRVAQAVAHTNEQNEGTSVVVTNVTGEIEAQPPEGSEGLTLVTIELPSGVARQATAMAILNDDLTFTAIPARFNADGSVTVIISGEVILVALSVESNFIDIEQLVQHVQDEINEAAARMIVQGVGNNRFDPTRAVLTSEAVTMFMRAIGMPTDADAPAVPGVNQDAWFAIYLNTAVANELIGDNVTPAQQMTRIQTAQLIVNALAHFGFTDTLTAAEAYALLAHFTDLEGLSSAQRMALAVTVDLGIFRGATETTMNPHGILNRSQMASLAVRLQNVLMDINQ